MSISDAADALLGKPALSGKPQDISGAADQLLGSNATVAHPMEQSLSPIPAGQEVVSPRPEGISGYEISGGKTTPIPDFMTKLKAMGSSTAQGLAEWGTALTRFLPGVKVDDSAVKYWSDINKKYTSDFGGGISNYQAVGKAIPDIAAFALVDKGRSLLSAPIEAAGAALKNVPGLNLLGKAVEKIGQGPSAIGEAAPFYSKTALKYGSAAGRDLTSFATVEGLKYDPENPDAGFNSDKALAMLENPSALAASAIGQKFSTYMNASRKLGQAKDLYSPYATAYQLKPQGPTRELEAKALGVLPNLFGIGKLVDQLRNVSNDTRTFVGKLLGNPEINRSIDAGELAGKHVQAALRRTKAAEDLAWENVPQQTLIQDSSAVKNSISNILDDLKTNTPLDAKLLNPLKSFGNKDEFTSGDIKKIQTKVGSVLSRLYQHEDASLMSDVISRVKTEKDGLLNILQSNLDDAGNAALSKARTISAQNFDLMGISPLIPKAVKNGVAAQQIADKMISEATGGKAMSPVFDKLSPMGQNAVAKYKLLKALDQHTNPDGTIALDPFLKSTGELSNVKGLVDTDTYKTLQGFNKYLQGVSEAAHTGWWTQMTVAGTAGAGAMSQGGTPKLLATAVAATYPVLGFIANHSPMKSLLHAATRNLSDNTYNAVMKAVEKYLIRGGFYVHDGIMEKK